MARRSFLTLVVLTSLFPAVTVTPAAAEAPATKAPIFEGLGTHRYPITTGSEEARKYFDQGLMLAYGFNHAEAERSFLEAARLDPECAMCFWGAAIVLGPNINAAMEPDRVPDAYAAAQKALALSSKVTPPEQALIGALTKRYVAVTPEDRKPLDEAYANAMREASKQHPDDLEIAVLFAESVLDTHPWNYWTPDHKPQPWTPEILETLERVLAKNPSHPGAIHFYIHAVEASSDPKRAEPYADRLPGLTPGLGHLVHMPAHTYARVGRYHDATMANVKATSVDEAYLTQCHAQGMYPLGYVPHNHHFLWSTASMEGWSAKAREAAVATNRKTDHKLMHEEGFGGLQHYALSALYVYVRFGWWKDILATQGPDKDLLYPTGIWHYARGRALTATGKLDEAEQELAALRVIADNDALEKVTIWDINPTSSLLEIAVEVLAGELAAKRGQFDPAIEHLRGAVELEDALNYDEPPDWTYPVRHSLGAVLLEAKRPEEAEAVYLQDLARNPENGWSLFGLMKSLQAQGKELDAAGVEIRFKKAWVNSDVALTSSRF